MKLVREAFVVLLAVLSISATAPKPEPYNVDEAYPVYGVLLPYEESYQFSGKGKIVIQQGTVSGLSVGPRMDVEACTDPGAKRIFREAIDDFLRMNKQTWLLQPRFEDTKPYEIVSRAGIEALFNRDPKAGKKLSDGWKAFYEHHPDSGGYHVMSAVGFNKDKTKAVVHSGSSCGWLCGRWRFHLLEKKDGKWHEVPGVQCTTMS